MAIREGAPAILLSYQSPFVRQPFTFPFFNNGKPKTSLCTLAFKRLVARARNDGACIRKLVGPFSRWKTCSIPGTFTGSNTFFQLPDPGHIINRVHGAPAALRSLGALEKTALDLSGKHKSHTFAPLLLGVGLFKRMRARDLDSRANDDGAVLFSATAFVVLGFVDGSFGLVARRQKLLPAVMLPQTLKLCEHSGIYPPMNSSGNCPAQEKA